MHTAGWVHRDVSPGNILLKEDGSILLTDLELAKEMGTQDEHAVVSEIYLSITARSLSLKPLGNSRLHRCGSTIPDVSFPTDRY